MNTDQLFHETNTTEDTISTKLRMYGIESLESRNGHRPTQGEMAENMHDALCDLHNFHIITGVKTGKGNKSWKDDGHGKVYA